MQTIAICWEAAASCASCARWPCGPKGSCVRCVEGPVLICLLGPGCVVVAAFRVQFAHDVSWSCGSQMKCQDVEFVLHGRPPKLYKWTLYCSFVSTETTKPSLCLLVSFERTSISLLAATVSILLLPPASSILFLPSSTSRHLHSIPVSVCAL